MLVEAADIMQNPGQFLLVDTRPLEQYVQGHIPGSLWINFYDYILESTTPEGISKLREFLRSSLSPLTNCPDQNIVFYENTTGMRAARALWFLTFAGGKQGSVLHGGLQSWLSEGGPIEAGEPVSNLHAEPYPVSDRSEVLATFDYVLDHIGKPGTVIVDSRGLSEYNGKSVDPCCTVKGRIPDSVHLNWEMLIDTSGKFLPKEQIIQIAAEKGITSEQEIIVYCHRGARSANTALALKWAGFQRVRNYIGSWHEWTRQPEAPIITGSHGRHHDQS